MPVVDGFHQALELLRKLKPHEQEKILTDMAKQDPAMAAKLKDNLIHIDDLITITPQMLMDLMNAIKIDDLGRSLKLANKATRDHFLNLLSSSLARDLTDAMTQPTPLDKVLESNAAVIHQVAELVSQGKILLDKDKSQRQV